MLPGLRFLFAAVVLTTSMLVFGLGAAALLRASHDRFVSTPKIRSAPPPMYARHSEPATPALTMLRVETPAPDSATAIDAAITVATAKPESQEPPPSPADIPPVAAVSPVEATDATFAVAPAAEADVAAKPAADVPSITVAAVAAAAVSPPPPTAAVAVPESPTPAPDQPAAPPAATSTEAAAIEIAAVSEALPVPPKLPVTHPVIKKKQATPHRVVKKRRHIVRRHAVPAVEQPAGAPSAGG